MGDSGSLIVGLMGAILAIEFIERSEVVRVQFQMVVIIGLRLHQVCQ
ncbi:MAG: hypothetical protein IPQ19_09140 [Bacteroidetes bacterium]|nr:hypothetical protein [Bacteroidota bacterium]